MEKTVILSERLTALTKMVTLGNSVCDVGCDHGFLSIYLIQKKISPRVLAMDVRRGPLSRAEEHIAEYGLDKYIEPRLSDGLESLCEGEADTLVCAGMGGKLMMKILTEGREKALGLKELILQPQSEVPQFRRFLRKEGYRTVTENIIEEDGKFYPMMKVIPTGISIPCEEPLFDLFGWQLLEKRHPVLKQYLEFQKKAALQIKECLIENENIPAKERLAKIEEELKDINRALARFT